MESDSTYLQDRELKSYSALIIFRIKVVIFCIVWPGIQLIFWRDFFFFSVLNNWKSPKSKNTKPYISKKKCLFRKQENCATECPATGPVFALHSAGRTFVMGLTTDLYELPKCSINLNGKYKMIGFTCGLEPHCSPLLCPYVDWCLKRSSSPKVRGQSAHTCSKCSLFLCSVCVTDFHDCRRMWNLFSAEGFNDGRLLWRHLKRRWQMMTDKHK